MKILLIHPKSNLQKSGHVQIPLGLAYIASYMLQKSDHKIKVFDEPAEKKGLNKLINEFKPDIIGVSFTALSAGGAYEIVKKYKDKAIFVAGGAYASFSPKEVLDNGFDYIVYGEGEKTFLQLVDRLDKKKTLNKQKGIIYYKDEKLIKNPSQKLIKNLDSLPLPARELFPMKKYEDFGTIMTARGCPFNCLFCNSRKFWQQKYRSRSISNIYKELEELVNKYKKKYIFFMDDTFTVDKDKVIKLCKLLTKKKLKFKWTALTRADTLDEEKISWMKKAGCDTLMFGVESGSEKILKNINKNTSLEKIRNSILLCKKYGIRARVSFIVGLPGSYKEQLKSLKIMEETTPENLNIHILAVYPGSEIYEKREKYGIHFKKIPNWYDYDSYYSTDLFKIVSFDYLSKTEAIKLCKTFVKRLKEIGYVRKNRDIKYGESERKFKTFIDF